VAVSAIIQTLGLHLSGSSVGLNWWGNTVAYDGVDYKHYNQVGSLYPIPEVGFGPAPSDSDRN